MKKFIAWLLVLTLTAAVSIGATLAYLTDTDEDVNVMTLGKVKIDQLEYERIDDETANEDAKVQEFHDNKPLYPAVTGNGFDYTPGDTKVDWTQIGKDGYTSEIWNPENINNELDKMVFIKNKGDYDAFVRTVFAFEAGNYTTLDQFKSMMHLNLNEDNFEWTWVESPVEIPNAEGSTTKYFVAVATYKDILKPGALTEISLSQIALDKTATNADVEAFGETYQILVKSQAIQADGFDTADFALNDGFGIVDAQNIPWQIDAPEQGVTVKNALHYLNGDATGQAITTKVTSVTFGLTKDYANIADNYGGVLVSEEQDVPVYAYYVPNGGNYDVYMLSSDTVYAPKDSTGLFQGMTNVTSIKTDKLDVSRVENATFMFRDCTKLPVLDTTDWDTSNITNMQGMFYKCNALSEITGITDWDVSSLKNLYATFYNMHAMTELDLSGWNVSNVTDLRSAIRANNNLSYVNLSGWDIISACDATCMLANNPALVTIDGTGMNMAGITNAYAMLGYNSSLTNIEGSDDWTFPNLTDASYMFEKDYALKQLNATNWGLSNVQKATGMFMDCKALETIVGSGEWSLNNVTDLQWMFQNSNTLKSIDVTSWNMSNCVRVDGMFLNCSVLETVEGTENWDTGNIESMYAMFYYNHKLKDVDVSTWNTAKNTNLSQMFSHCYDLEELDVSNWDVSKVTDFSYMFKGNQNKGDMKLKNLDVSNWNPVSAVNMLCIFYSCGEFTEMDLSGWNMPNLINAGHLFADCLKLEKVDMSGWNTPSLLCVDAMFNNCESLKTVDLSDLDTANVKEFSQMFEACYALETVEGMENWDTSSACTFTEMFSGCGKLKELDLSSFDTGAAFDNYTDMNNSTSHAFVSMLSSVNSLEKLVVSDKISYYGNGNVTEGRKLVFPNPVAKEGYIAKWQNVDTGAVYLGKDIPEKTAATYVPYYEYDAKGAKMIDALNYLNANPKGTKITTKVTSVTFGLTEDYAEIANTYTGVLADQEQENPVYAYYVPNGSNYDVYMLASDTIYAPVDCSNLCLGMSNLVSFNTANFDTSKTTSMYRMFRECKKLTTIDVSKWDTSNVTNMQDLFRLCSSLTTLDVSNWKTGKVQVLTAAFQDCAQLTELDLNNWDVSNVTTAIQMFNRCNKLETLKISNWKPKNLSNGTTMFQDCKALKELDLSGWNTSSLTIASGMFNHCESLTTLNVSTWDMRKLTTANLMFQACYSLENLDLSQWQTPSLQNMQSMFFDCKKLTELNVGSMDVSNVTDFKQMFSGCARMEYLHGLGNWNTSKGTDFYAFINKCGSLKEVDLTKFDTSNATNMEFFFDEMHSLQKLTVGENFSCNANGKLTAKAAIFPKPATVEGSDGLWHNVATGEAFAPKDIPQGAATYVAVNPNP